MPYRLTYTENSGQLFYLFGHVGRLAMPSTSEKQKSSPLFLCHEINADFENL